MADFVLYEVINTFDKSELRQFGKFVRSPFFTHRSEMERMYAFLAHCRYREKALPDKETLFRKSFPDRPYHDLLLRATMSDLCELMEEYLIWQRLRADEVAAKLALVAEFRERNLSKLFQQTTRKLQQYLEDDSVRNARFHRKMLDYQVEIVQFQTRTVRTGELPLQDISNSIDILYLAEKLRHSCTQISHQAVFKTSYVFGLLPNVLDQVESDNYLQVPAIALYYYCYRFLTEPVSLLYFQKFRTELQQNGHFFPDTELKDLYLLAINYCIRKINEGGEPFIREGWELYREGLEKGFLLENRRLSPFTFNNIVAFGIKLGVYADVEQFIRHYQSFLEPAQQESLVSFNLARLEYKRGNHNTALRLLQTADFKDLVNNMIAKTLLLKIYFELEEFDLLESHLDTFRQFIRRRELSDYHRRNYLNVITFVKKITALPPANRTEKTALRTEIEQAEVLTEREWLLEQLERK
ncbi:MAG: hypothetical protein IPL27_16105 [Lewinellaceae bacterium]|nr:hypothetical protein [Lewinellaceae bacterium]